MIVICKRPGGLGLPKGIRLKRGHNEIDQNLWAEMLGVVNPQWFKAVSVDIEVKGFESKPKKAEPKPEPKREVYTPAKPPDSPGLEMSAKDAISEIEDLKSLAKLKSWTHGETRKTVIAAIEKRAAQIQAS